MDLDDAVKRVLKRRPGFLMPPLWLGAMTQGTEGTEGTILIWSILTTIALWEATTRASETRAWLGELAGYDATLQHPFQKHLQSIRASDILTVCDPIQDTPQLSHVLTFEQALDFTVEPADELRRKFDAGAIVPCTKIGRLESRNLPLYFVARASDVSALGDSDTANRRLGLGHLPFYGVPPASPFARQTYLVELRYSPGFRAELERPSAFCAGHNVAFRMETDGDRKWGRTQDLTTLLRDLDEAYHEPTTSDRDFMLRPLGYVTVALVLDLDAVLTNALNDFATACSWAGI